MMGNKVMLFFLIIFSLSSFSCEKKKDPIKIEPRTGLDESNLEMVIDHVYHPGATIPSVNLDYKFLSLKTREQVTPEQWKAVMANQNNIYDLAAILKKEVIQRVTYGIVYLSETVDGMQSITTSIWVLEENKWRRLKLPLIKKEISDALKNKGCAAANKVAESWLAVDPFSIDAYESLIVCIETSGPKELKAGHRSVDEIIRKLMSINPDDTKALYIAAVHAKDASRYLKKLRGTVAYQPAIDALAAKAAANADAGPRDDAMLVRQLSLLLDLNKYEEFKKLATQEDVVKRVIKFLDTYDKADAANYAAKIGMAFYQKGDKMHATVWMDYGMDRDASTEAILTLYEKLTRDQE